MSLPKLLKLRTSGDIIPLPAYACRQGHLYTLSFVLLRGHNNSAQVSAVDPDWSQAQEKKENKTLI